MTLEEFYRKGKEQLHDLYEEQEGVAILKLLASYVLHLEDAQLLLATKKELLPEQEEVLEASLEEVVKGVPVQYVLGGTTFYGLDLYVEPGVLIPRQETEELVDWILKEEAEAKQILDVGVGSGCITIALGRNLKNAHLTAIDVSFKALDLARENCDLYDLRPTFLSGDILKWQDYGLGQYDVIVSNPPYIREFEKKVMHRNVLEHEPETALFVPDNNPLLFYEAIAELGQVHLNEGGSLYFEINEALGEETVALLEHKAYRNVELRQDLNGKNRMVRAQK